MAGFTSYLGQKKNVGRYPIEIRAGYFYIPTVERYRAERDFRNSNQSTGSTYRT